MTDKPLTEDQRIPEVAMQFRKVIDSPETDTYAQAALELRRWMIANDPHYPIYHFAGPESWINDPNGPIYHNGRYHLFYQFDPMVSDGAGGWRRSARCWGHAISEDLVHWVDWPVALWPNTPQDYGGVYSGNTFIDEDGTACALYTGNTTGNDGLRYGILARSRDDMLTWEKQVVMDHGQRPNPDTPAPDAPIIMHIYLDRSIIEVFINGCALTARIFPPPDARGLQLFAEDEKVTVESVDIYEMQTMWR